MKRNFKFYNWCDMEKEYNGLGMVWKLSVSDKVLSKQYKIYTNNEDNDED